MIRHTGLVIWSLLAALAGASPLMLAPASGGAASPDDAAAVTGTAATAAIALEVVPDPFPIRRVYLNGDQRPAALAQESRGVLTRLTRAEFESRVRAATRAAASPPRLATARYTARLTDRGLAGTATWQFDAAGPGLVPVEPLLPAVSSPRRADGSPVPLFRGEPAGRPAAAYLWLDRAGESTVLLDWTARGVEEPAVERFELAFPPANLAGLELDLPVDRIPSTGTSDLLLTGPVPGRPGRSLWQLLLSGHSRFELSIRLPGGPAPAVKADRVSRFDLSTGQVGCVVEFDLESVHGPTTEVLVEVDPGVQVTDITGPGRLTWQQETGGPAGGPGRYRVFAAEAGSLSRVVVNGVAQLAGAPGAWSAPQARVVGGFPGDDVVEIRLSPDLRFQGLDPGDYRVTTSSGTERGYRVTLSGTRRPTDVTAAERRPPRLEVRPAEAEFACRDELTWRVGGDRSEVVLRSQVRVTRGPVTAFQVEVPAGLSPGVVELIPEDPGVAWGPLPEGEGRIVVEPSRPIYGGQSVGLRVVFHGPPPAHAPGSGPTAVPFPQAGLVGASEREGILSVEVSPAFRAWPAPGRTDAASIRNEGRSLVLPYRGRLPLGDLLLSRSDERLVVARDAVVGLTEGVLTSTVTLTARPSVGEFNGLTLFTPRTPGTRWSIQAEGADVLTPISTDFLLGLSALSVASGWGTVPILGGELPLGGEYRSVVLPRRTGEPLTIVATSTAPASVGPAEGIPIPLPAIPGAILENSRITLLPATAALYEVTTALPTSESLPPSSPRLRPRGSIQQSAVKAGEWRFGDVTLAVRIGPDGRPTCRLTGRVLDAGGGGLPIGLPADAEVLSLRIADRLVLPQTPFEESEGRVQVTLPLPVSEPGGIPFEISYRLESPPPFGGVAYRFGIRLPTLPGPPASIETRWSAADDFRPWPDLGPPDERTEPGEAQFLVIRTSVLTGVGNAIAAIVLGITVPMLVTGGVRRGWLIIYAAGVGALAAALWILSDGWALVLHPPFVVGLGGLVVLSWLASRRTGDPIVPVGSTVQQPPSRRRRLSSTAPYGSAAILLAVLVAASPAQAPEPGTVFLVNGPDREAGTLDVLAPPAILERLANLTRTPAPPVVVTAAEYEGQADAVGAGFVARFRVLSTRDGEQVLSLPLGGVRLESMELDGKPAFPDGSRADRYGLTIRGAGWHDVVARFFVPAPVTGVERVVRFAVPDVPSARVRFAAPPRARTPEVQSRRGEQSVEQQGDRIHVTADHGGGRAVVIQWRDVAGDQPADVSVQEACVWDLSGGSDTATVALLCRVDDGAVPGIAIEIPDGVEPGRFLVRSGDGRSGGPALKDWTLAPAAEKGWRVLNLAFQAPAEGRFVVLFDLFARGPGTAGPTLRFPRTKGVARVDSYYGLRLKGMAVANMPRTGVIDYPADGMSRAFASVPELGLDRSPPDRAFQRVMSGPIPELRPILRPAAEAPTWSSEVAWRVGPRLEVEGTLRVALPAGLSLIEFDLPEVIGLDEIRAPDLFTWGRSGTRVQVWLRKPAREATVRWSGSLTSVPKERKPEGEIEVVLPCPRPPDRAEPTVLRVRGADGWVASPQSAKGMRPLPGGGPAEGVFQVDPDTPAPRFTLLPPRNPTRLATRETVEASASTLRFSSALTITMPAGRPHHGTIALVGLSTRSEVEIRGPEGVAIGPAGVEPDSVRWSVFVPPSATGPLEFVLSTQVPPGRLPVPQVTFGGPPVIPTDRVLVLPAGEFTVADGPPGWRRARPDEIEAESAGQPDRAVNVFISERQSGPWTVKPAPASGQPPADRAAVRDPLAPPADTPAPVDEPFTTSWDWLAAVGCGAGLLVVIGLAGWGRPGWLPERLMACGLIGVSILGAESPAGLAFAGTALVGGAARLLSVARWITRLVLR